MLYIICCVIFAFFIVWKITDIFRLYAFESFTAGSSLEPEVILVPLKGHAENAEFIIRSAINRIIRQRPRTDAKIICIDMGMDNETRKICDILATSYECLTIIQA